MTVLAERELVGLLLPAPLIFAGFFIAFAVKLPMFPLHTWLPDAHTDAPTAVSVMLAGVLLKMGGYGLIRLNAGIFPEQMRDAGPFLATFGLIGIIYGAFVVVRQTDLKRLIAYSSVSHMGFVLLGLASVGAAATEFTPVGLNGAAMQLFTHGTITGLLFVVVGLIYDRVHTRHIPDLGGLVRRMPIIGIALVLAGLGSLGLPSTSGFVSEVLIFIGAFDVYPVMTGFAASGVVLAAAYILWMIQRTMFGPSSDRWDDVVDASKVDIAAIAVLAIPIFIIGIYPRFLIDMFDSGLIRIAAGFG
jgi:NADH-quinone oxidoreductase subunit M